MTIPSGVVTTDLNSDLDSVWNTLFNANRAGRVFQYDLTAVGATSTQGERGRLHFVPDDDLQVLAVSGSLYSTALATGSLFLLEEDTEVSLLTVALSFPSTAELAVRDVRTTSNPVFLRKGLRYTFGIQAINPIAISGSAALVVVSRARPS